MKCLVTSRQDCSRLMLKTNKMFGDFKIRLHLSDSSEYVSSEKTWNGNEVGQENSLITIWNKGQGLFVFI